MNSKNLYSWGVLVYAASLFGGMLVLPLMMGLDHPLMRNLVAGAPIAINLPTIVFTVGMIVFFAICQTLAFRGQPEYIKDLGTFFLVYGLMLVFLAANLRVWMTIFAIGLVLIVVEHTMIVRLQKSIVPADSTQALNERGFCVIIRLSYRKAGTHEWRRLQLLNLLLPRQWRSFWLPLVMPLKVSRKVT